MTKEEAIERAKAILEEATETEDAVSYVNGEDAEWLRMAIAALGAAPCEDAISRQAMNKCVEMYCGAPIKLAMELRKLPSVNPQPKTGHWIVIDEELQRYKCSECGEIIKVYDYNNETLKENYRFSHCGAKMESEEQA